MDVKKLLAKLPAFVKKFRDATNIDGKVSWQDVLFVMDLVQLGLEQTASQPQATAKYFMAAAEPREGLDAPNVGLDPGNHAQMMSYLSTLPGSIDQPEPQTEGRGDQPRQLTEWVPVVIFGVNLLGKLLAAWKKKNGK